MQMMRIEVLRNAFEVRGAAFRTITEAATPKSLIGNRLKQTQVIRGFRRLWTYAGQVFGNPGQLWRL